MTTKDRLAIGVDLGATKIAAASVTDQGVTLAEARASTAAREGEEAVIARIAQVVDKLVERTPGEIAGVGIGAPGYVDPETGVVRNAVNLGWREVALAARVRSRLETKYCVWAENDTNVQALGEYFYGAGRGCANLVYIGIGSGLGSGILVNGQLVSGDTFTAAEIGHLSLEPDGRLCACGLRGCVETVVSGPGILASARELLGAGKHTSQLQDTLELTSEQVLQAARAGDPVGVAVFAETARWLGIAFAAFVAILNPAKIIVGGGLGRSAFDLLIPGALTELRRRVVPASYERLDVAPSQLSSSAVGASCLVWQANAR